ncbi:interactor of HORMAD1 protein 1 [Ctenodactylus gundi]
MNFNVWNVKEMLSIPSGSGTTKSSNWNNNQTDYSALSDSQFLFGSQFCPENSETLLVPLDLGTHLRKPKETQQNSLDNEPTIFTKYQTKPQLFEGNTKDTGLFSLPLPVGKSKDFLKQFEEKNKRAKDKYDSETLYNFVSQVRESIQKLQTSEEYLSSRSQCILDSLETVAKILQETTQAQSDLMAEAVQDKVNMEQAILEMQKKCEARQIEFTEIKSNLKHLEVLVAQQSKDFQQLCEQLGQQDVPSVLAELKRLILVTRVPEHVKDSASQTSPSLARSLNFTKQEELPSEELAMWQAQPSCAVGNPTGYSLRTKKVGVRGKRAKNDALQEEEALLAVGPPKEKEYVKEKVMQTDSQHWAVTKTGPKDHGSNIQDHTADADRDLVSHRVSQITPLDSANIIQNVFPEYQAQSTSSCDPGEQLVTKQKDRTVGTMKSKKQQPSKVHKGRTLAKKREQNPSKTWAFNSKYQTPQSPVFGPQRSFMGQQEPLSQLHKCPRSPLKPVCVQGGIVKASKTTKAGQRSFLEFAMCSSQENNPFSSSSQEDHQLSWFSGFHLESSKPPLHKKPGKNALYHLQFDSSDDDF